MNHHVPCTRQSTCETMACPRSYGLVHIEGQRMALICEPDVGSLTEFACSRRNWQPTAYLLRLRVT
jgi:hypothetical protein